MGKYIITKLTELESVGYPTDTLRKSVDGTLAVVEFEGNMPADLKTTSFEGPYLAEEIIPLLNNEQWRPKLTA